MISVFAIRDSTIYFVFSYHQTKNNLHKNSVNCSLVPSKKKKFKIFVFFFFLLAMAFCMSHSIMHSLIQQVFVLSVLDTKHYVPCWDPCDQIYVVKRGFKVLIFEICRTSHQALVIGVTWAWEEKRSQGWNPVFLTWQWLESIVIHWN